jgi:hypothetical protein
MMLTLFWIYFGIFQRYALSDVPVDDKAPAETSKISISVGAQSFRGAHRGGVCVRVFIGVSGVRVVSVCVVLCNSKKRSSSSYRLLPPPRHRRLRAPARKQGRGGERSTAHRRRWGVVLEVWP